MDNEEKKYFRDIKMALRKLSEIGVPVTPIIKAVMNAESVLAEIEDERLRKELIEQVQFIVPKHDECDENGKELPCYRERIAKYIAYLEKQKEPEKEELVYRLNGLMQDYIKEGKDDEEKEHRFKCYKLFWDALEDASYFEQKEQKRQLADGTSSLYL